MQTRARVANTRPLPVAVASDATSPARPSSTSFSSSSTAIALPTTTQPARHRRTHANSIAPLSVDLCVSTLPAAPGTLSTPTHLGANSGRSATPLDAISTTTPHMPALPSSATTPTARHSLTSPTQRALSSQHRGTTLSPLQEEGTSGRTAANMPPARLRSLGNSNMDREVRPSGGEGGVAHDSLSDNASNSNNNSMAQQRTRQRSNGSTTHLPAMLQPNKLAAAPTATLPSMVLTSPARMVSQPDVNALGVSSPARRGCLTGGGSGVTSEGQEDGEGVGSCCSDTSDRRASTGLSAPPATPAYTITRPPAPTAHGGRNGVQEGRETLPIPPPPPPPASATATRRPRYGSGHRRTLSPNVEASREEAYLSEHPRVRALVNNLYQHVVMAQPEDPLKYLAQLGSQPHGSTAEPELRLLSRRHSSTYPPHVPGVQGTADTATTNATTTIATDTRQSSIGNDSNTNVSPAPSPDMPSQQQQQQQQPPLSPASSTASTHPTPTTTATATVSGCGANGVQHPFTTYAPITATTMSVNGTNGGGSDNNTSVSGPATHYCARSSAASHAGGSGSRDAYLLPPSVPTPPLPTRLQSAGSSGAAASLRSTFSSSKLGSPFPPTRCTTQVGHSMNSAACFSGSASRVMGHQASLVGSLSGFYRGDATASEASSLFSTNSVDLQEFLTEFRMAKEECCGGGIEAPLITFDDLATILESVAFPFTDVAALMDLFDELQPCAHYLAAIPTTGGGSSQSRRPRDTAGASASLSSPSPVHVAHLQNSSSSNRSGAEAFGSSRGAADALSVPCGGAGEATPAAAFDTLKATAITVGAGEESIAVVAAAVPGRLSVAAEGCRANVPPPPPLKRNTTNNSVGGVPSQQKLEGEEAKAVTAVVPFDTFMARMAYKIHGRYTAEAIRIAFYGMIVDDEVVTEGGPAAAATTATGHSYTVDSAGLRQMSHIFSTDSLTSSEPAATFSTTTTLSDTGMPTCTVPLMRCLSEGLFGRLGMVDLTGSEVQRGVRSAGLPTAPEDQPACECRLADFARLVRAVTTVADRGFSISPANFCLSSLRDGAALQRGPSSTATSWKEDSAAAGAGGAAARGTAGRMSGVSPPVHTIRYL